VLDQLLQLAGDRRLFHVLHGHRLLHAEVCGGAGGGAASAMRAAAHGARLRGLRGRAGPRRAAAADTVRSMAHRSARPAWPRRPSTRARGWAAGGWPSSARRSC
jgi:hypothetical protein